MCIGKNNTSLTVGRTKKIDQKSPPTSTFASTFTHPNL